MSVRVEGLIRGLSFVLDALHFTPPAPSLASQLSTADMATPMLAYGLFISAGRTPLLVWTGKGSRSNPTIESTTNLSSCVILSSQAGNLVIFQFINDDLQKELKLPRYKRARKYAAMPHLVYLARL